jgi:hypothetical protein
LRMRSLALLLCAAFAVASSFPDKTSCIAEDPTLDTLMAWVLPAVHTDAYTLRTGDGCAVSADPTSYIPGQFTSIHLRTHKYKGQFRGFLMYATDAAGKRVGDWHLDWPNSNMFWKPEGPCQNISLMHLDGSEKYYHHEFKFIAPPAGTGTIEFHTLIKRGEANTGEFYYANMKNLVLAEGSTSTYTTTWIEGVAGSSCTSTCTAANKVCDATLLNNAFKWAGALQKDVLMSVGCAATALTSDTAITVSKDLGWCTYPSPLVGQTSDSCNSVPTTGTPICPCGSAGLPSFGPNVPPPETACLNTFMVMGSASKYSSSALSFFLVLLTGAFVNHNKQSNLLLTLVCVLFCAYTVQAHNWVYAVSRSFNQASTYKPCRPKVNDVPHWQINQKQEFTMEWATGHDHYFYFTVVHAEDILLLENTTQNDLDNYIKGCASTDDYMAGKTAAPGRWAKQHINRNPSLTSAISTVDQVGVYEKNISQGDPAYIPRHPKFGPYNNEVRWVYKTAYTMRDKRCSYFNANLPYIVAVHRFVQVDTVMSRAGDRDTARFTIDLSAGHVARHGLSGQYLVQYLWRGYFDCADVELFPDTIPVTDIGGRALRTDEPQWNKVDHCQFEEVQGLETSCSEVVTNANRCLKSCVANVNCGGVNVVPMWLPKTVYPLFSNRVGIPWDNMGRCSQSKFVDLSRNARVCYGVSPRLPNNTHSMYSVTDDPEDPLFYATCFIKRSQWTFDLSLGNSTGATLKPIPPAWAYKDKCVDCMEWKASQENFDIPSWKLPENCVNCETATLPPVPALPGSIISRGTKCDGAFSGRTIWNYQKVSPVCAAKRCVKTLFLVGAPEIKADECIAKAKADPECSEFVQHRGNGLRMDGCECFLKDPCCGTCVPVDVDFRNWEWNVYTTKPQIGDSTCLKGVKSSDGQYCCSASCVDANGVGSCMPVPGLQVSFQAAAMNAPDGWAVDNGAAFGTRTTPGYTSTLSSSYGWNCDLTLTPEDRSSEDGTNYHSTVVKPDTGICNLGTILPEWRVTVPNGFYQVDTLYSKPFSQLRSLR